MMTNTPDQSGLENLPPVPASDHGDGVILPPVKPAEAPVVPALGPIGSAETKPTLKPIC
jgi:hypothetical protein